MKALQGTPGVKAPPSVEEGAPIPVEVEVEGVDHVLVTDGQPNSKPEKVPVGPGGNVSIPPRPQWTAGTILFIYTNNVPVRGVLVEIVSTH